MMTFQTQFISIYKVYQLLLNREMKVEDMYLIQKIGYLTDKACGIYLGDYIWSFRNNSPYSPSLATVINEGLKEISNECNQYILNENATNILKELQTFLTNKPFDITIDDYIHETAIIHYYYIQVKQNKYSEYIKKYKNDKNDLTHFVANEISKLMKEIDKKRIYNAIKNMMQYKFYFMSDSFN